MDPREDELARLRSTAMQNAASTLLARERVEQELAQANARLRATFEATSDGLIVVDNEGIVTDCNSRMLALWRVTADEISGKRFADVVAFLAPRFADPEDLELFDVRTGVDIAATLTLVDGRMLEIATAPQRIEDRVVGRVWSFRDVTIESGIAQSLKANHARFAAIIDQLPAGVLLVDSHLRMQHVNPRAIAAFAALRTWVGSSFEEIVSATWSNAVATEIVAQCRRTLESGDSYRSPMSVKTPGGGAAEQYYDFELHRLLLPDGQLGVACYFIDVTSYVFAQRAVQVSQKRVRAMFDQAGVGMAIAGLDGRFVDMNAKFARILGYSEQELGELTYRDITVPADREEMQTRLGSLFAGEVDDFSIEKRYMRKDGSIVWSLTTVALLKDSGNAATEFVVVIDDISERKSAQQAVYDSAQRLQLALAAGDLGAWAWNPASDEVHLSERAAEIFGIAADEPITWASLRERIVPQDRELARTAVEQSLAKNEDYGIEYRVQRSPDEVVWVLAQGRGVYAENGDVLSMTGVVQDVTKRKSHELLRRQLAAVVETSEDAIITKSLDGTITTWNTAAERIFGYSAEEITGRSIMQLIPPDRQDEERAILQRLTRGERIEHFETVRVRKDGSTIDISLSVSPLRDERGRIVGASKIARDVTASKRAAEALAEESRALNILNESGQAIAAELDMRSIIQSVTDSTTKLTNAAFGAFFYNTQDSSGGSYQLFTLSGAPREAFEKFGMPRATPLFAATFAGEGPVRIDDVLEDPRYGQMAPHHGMPAGHLPVRSYLAVPVISRSGEVIGGLFFGHPKPRVFTARLERMIIGIAAQAAIAIHNARLYERISTAAEERKILLEAERAARSEAERVSIVKDEFLATLSHELRTPLNAILGWAQVLQRSKNLAQETLDGLAVIERNARVQTQLIEDLLDMSRIISGKIRLDVQRVELSDVVKAAVESVRHSAEAKGIHMHVVLDPVAGPVWGDPNRLQQCVWNLLSNAIKFTPRGKRVQVTVSRVSSHVELNVSDTGLGIPPDFLPHVFDRFRQADASTTRRYGGLGLGLAIVKNLVELHGGTVRATSAGVDQGATFYIELPLMVVDLAATGSAREHPRSESGRLPRTDLPSLAGIDVLVVDDEPDARNLVKRILEDCGAHVFLASSAREAMLALVSRKPQVLISDLGMPEEDGYVFIRKVRELKPEDGGRIRAAALSAFARAEDRTRALRAGYDTHVAKPVEAAELAAVVASLAQR